MWSSWVELSDLGIFDGSKNLIFEDHRIANSESLNIFEPWHNYFDWQLQLPLTLLTVYVNPSYFQKILPRGRLTCNILLIQFKWGFPFDLFWPFGATVVISKYKTNVSYLSSGGEDGRRIALTKCEANISKNVEDICVGIVRWSGQWSPTPLESNGVGDRVYRFLELCLVYIFWCGSVRWETVLQS